MNIVSVIRVSINLGDIPLNAYRVTREDKSFVDLLAGKSVSSAIGEHDSTLPRSMGVKSLKELGIPPVKCDWGETIIPIPFQRVIDYWFTFAEKGNKKAQYLLLYIKTNKTKPFEEFYNMPLPTYRSKTGRGKPNERQVKLRLHSEVGGEVEVPCAAGFIDILTATELIEVKNIKDWKSAIGQVLVYGKYYPSHQKRIHLFGKCHTSYLDLVRIHCNEFNIILTFE
jgi:hypothetical protein